MTQPGEQHTTQFRCTVNSGGQVPSLKSNSSRLPGQESQPNRLPTVSGAPHRTLTAPCSLSLEQVGTRRKLWGESNFRQT